MAGRGYVAVAVHGDKIRPTESVVSGHRNRLNVVWTIKKMGSEFHKCHEKTGIRKR